MIGRLIRIGVTRALLGPAAVVVLCILLAWGTAGCSSPDDDAVWEDDPLGTWREYEAELPDRLESRSLTPVGAWVIARGAAIEAGAGPRDATSAAYLARWEQDLPCWSEHGSSAYGGGLPVCSGGDQ